MKTCETCRGQGEIVRLGAQRGQFRELIGTMECPECSGQGEVPRYKRPFPTIETTGNRRGRPARAVSMVGNVTERLYNDIEPKSPTLQKG
jgi:DnaJ-class molecular chaperone